MVESRADGILAVALWYAHHRLCQCEGHHRSYMTLLASKRGG